MAPSLLARIVLVAAAAAAIFVLAAWQHEEDRCQSAIKALFHDLRDDAPDPEVAAGVERVEDDCHGGLRLIGPAAVLTQEGERGHAATLLREAIRREPGSFSAWSGLAAVVRESDPAESARAAAQARELNPRHRPGR